MFDKLCEACDSHTEYERIQGSHKRYEKRVIVLPDAGPQPDAVMVELLHAVVAQVTVSALGRAKNQASLAELERRDGLTCELRTIRSLALVDKVKDSLCLAFDLQVLLLYTV